jgi:hypothetical protein
MTYVNPGVATIDPPVVMTVMGTAPETCFGLVTVSDVVALTEIAVAVSVPNFTESTFSCPRAAVKKNLPDMWTTVPPVVGPFDGVTEVIEGWGTT